MSCESLEELLRDEIGLDPTSVGSSAHSARGEAADEGSETGRPGGVRASGQSNQTTELQELIEEVIVAESWFFRDERPFEWLRDYVRERWIGAPARPPLRILSLPCAAGEEPYSIAIVLSEEGLPARRYQIDAVDISARRLASARRGVYSQNAFRGPDDRVPVALLSSSIPKGMRSIPRYGRRFDSSREAFSILGCSRGSPPYDVVFCRNLLIYLVPSARAALLALIDRCAGSDGVLLIGHADRLDSTGAARGFAATGDLGCFAYRRISVAREPPSPSRLCTPLESPRPILEPAVHLPQSVQSKRAVARYEAQCNRRAAGSCQDLLIHLTPHAVEPSLLLSQASELANQGRFMEAIACCERHLREQGVTAPAYCLMGMICQAAGDRGRAEDCFRKAVYLDPNHDEALLALALLAEHRGDQNAAAGFRRRAERTATLSRKRVN